MTHDDWEPRLRVRASGLGGSGYAIPTRPRADGKPSIVPGVTTCLGALDKPGVLQWSIDNVAAYAVTHLDDLLNRTEEQGFGFLRFYHKRMKEADFDDPMVDLRNSSNGVLNDLAELGTMTHDWVADFVTGMFPEAPVRDEQAQMIEQFLDWYESNDVQVIATEVSVVGDNYAGTLDHLWVVNGVPTLIDVKGLPLDTQIPTPTGFTTMGDLQVGDTVFGSDGNPCNVTFKSVVHHNPCMEITFDTGETVVADHEHRWAVTLGPTNSTRQTVLTTEEIQERLSTRKGQRDVRILNPEPLNLPEADLPLDPYVLGVWLSDGTATKNEITLNDTTKVGVRDEIERRGWKTTHVTYPSDKKTHGVRIALGEDRGQFGTQGSPSRVSEFKALLRDLNLLGNKHIPLQYARASKAQRLDLLRGIMDGDGAWNIARGNRVVLSTTDAAWRDEVHRLVASLGVRVTKHQAPVSWVHKGEKKWKTAYHVSFKADTFNPFLRRDFPYKARKEGTLPMSARRVVVSVKNVETVPTQCIEVDSADHTYLFGESMIVTHNTSRAVRDEHYAQLAALGAAESMMVEVDAEHPGAVEYDSKKWGKTYWVEEPLPDFSQYAILHLRPDDVSSKGEFIPAFCEFKVIPHETIDAAFDLFTASRDARLAQRRLKEVQK